jgi:hypothetical protein
MEQSPSWEANSRPTLNQSRNSPYFIELEDLLPCSQEPATGPRPEPDESNLRTPNLFS